MTDPNEPPHLQALRHAVHRAMQEPERYLAAPLAEETDEALALAMGADPAAIWRLRLAQYPRPACWQTDVFQLATIINGDPFLLEAYLRGRGLGPEV